MAGDDLDKENETDISQTANRIDLPVAIRQEACISVRSSFTGCALCVEACPDNCLKFEKGMLAMTADECSMCGVCAAICPSSAITLKRHGDGVIYDAIDKALEDSPDLKFGCRLGPSPNGGRKDEIVLPCLSMAGETFLADAALEGARSILLAAPCGTCNVQAGSELIKRSAGRASVLLSALEKNSDIRLELTGTVSGDDEKGVPVGEKYTRRDFIGGLTKTLAKGTLAPNAEEAVPNLESGYLKPIGITARRRRLNDQLRGLVSSRQIFAENESPLRVIQINDNCTACMACSVYCPTGAISRDENPGGVSIVFSAQKCVKCTGCAELCPEGAISYQEEFTVEEAMAGPLVKFEKGMIECISCDRPFMPKGDEKQCRACSKFVKFQKGLLKSIRRES